MELITTHTHTLYSNHGEGTVDELVRAARKAGISTIAITEHFPLSSAFDPEDYLSIRPHQLPSYFDDVTAAIDAYHDIEIILGTEFDFLGTCEDRDITPASFDPYCLVLGSVHFVDGNAFDDPAKKCLWDEPAYANQVWKRYFEIWCDAATCKLPFDIMSHPDLPKKFNYYPSFDLESVYQSAAEAAQAGGRMIEVNTSGAHYLCNEMFPALRLLTLFCKAGIPCTVGTDAHTPQNVARGITDAYRLMYEAGYRVVTVPTKTGDRRTIKL